MTTQRKGRKMSSILLRYIIAAGVLGLSFGVAVGYATWHVQPLDAMTSKVWIEFSSVQHALDAAGTLGGAARGLTVCLGNPEIKERGLWMPPGVNITGNRQECTFMPNGRGLAVLHPSSNNVVSHLNFYWSNTDTALSVPWRQ